MTERRLLTVRAAVIAAVTLALAASLAIAEPELIVRYPDGVPHVSIAGNFAGASYTVWRAPAEGGAFVPLASGPTLCMGPCFAVDPAVEPGASYRYRFDLVMPAGASPTFVSYGPYLATISPALGTPVGVFAWPNPGRGATTLQLHVGRLDGARGEAAIYDLAGRRVRALHHGPLAQRLTTLTWDGRDDRGMSLAPGVYLLRFSAGGRDATMRLIRR